MTARQNAKRGAAVSGRLRVASRMAATSAFNSRCAKWVTLTCQTGAWRSKRKHTHNTHTHTGTTTTATHDTYRDKEGVPRPRRDEGPNARVFRVHTPARAVTFATGPDNMQLHTTAAATAAVLT